MENWKNELSSIIEELIGLKPYQHAHNKYGRALQTNAISVVLNEVRGNSSVMDIYDFNTMLTGEFREGLDEIRKELPAGYIAYLGTTRWLEPYNSPEEFICSGLELVAGRGKTQTDILKLSNTEAPNYDLTSEQIASELANLDRSVGINILHAEADTIHFELESAIPNKSDFTKRLFELCPDLESDWEHDEYIEYLNNNTLIELWWD